MPDQTDQTIDTEQLRRDLAGAQFRVQELETKLAAVEAQRDASDVMANNLHERIAEMHREHRAARVGSPDTALTISALVDLHRLTASAPGKDAHRYLAAAQKLAAPLVETILAD